MKRMLMVLTVALVMAAMMVATAMPAFADAGGVPNENACAGQVNKLDNQRGFTPAEIARAKPRLFGNAGDVEKFIRIFPPLCG